MAAQSISLVTLSLITTAYKLSFLGKSVELIKKWQTNKAQPIP